MKEVSIIAIAGSFAENKDAAQMLRKKEIMPALKNGDQITLDFSGVTGATQSFIHALISEALRRYGDEALDLISFKQCNSTVQAIISTVVSYMQES